MTGISPVRHILVEKEANQPPPSTLAQLQQQQESAGLVGLEGDSLLAQATRAGPNEFVLGDFVLPKAAAVHLTSWVSIVCSLFEAIQSTFPSEATVST